MYTLCVVMGYMYYCYVSVIVCFKIWTHFWTQPPSLRQIFLGGRIKYIVSYLEIWKLEIRNLEMSLRHTVTS